MYHLEQKIKEIPNVGEQLSMVPVMISLVKNYVQGKYTTVPYGTILAILSALIYLLSQIDLIPDFLPGIGYLDDIAVVGFCITMVKADIDSYDVWRQAQGLI